MCLFCRIRLFVHGVAARAGDVSLMPIREVWGLMRVDGGPFAVDNKLIERCGGELFVRSMTCCTGTLVDFGLFELLRRGVARRGLFVRCAQAGLVRMTVDAAEAFVSVRGGQAGIVGERIRFDAVALKAVRFNRP